jgi:hypothetical protein
MVIERLPRTRASRTRRPRNLWPVMIAIMALIGTLGVRLIAQH